MLERGREILLSLPSRRLFPDSSLYIATMCYTCHVLQVRAYAISTSVDGTCLIREDADVRFDVYKHRVNRISQRSAEGVRWHIQLPHRSLHESAKCVGDPGLSDAGSFGGRVHGPRYSCAVCFQEDRAVVGLSRLSKHLRKLIVHSSCLYNFGPN